MTTLEFLLALAATAAGSPFLVEAFKALLRWRQGYTSKVAALESAVNEAETLIDELRAQQRATLVAHAEEIDGLFAQVRQLERTVHRYHWKLISLGADPDEE